MSTILNKVLNFVGWETEDEEEDVETVEESEDVEEEESKKPQFIQPLSSRRTQNKVVNIHSASQFKVIVMQPESFNDAKDVVTI